MGGHLAQHGYDVTLVDMWPENIAIRAHGLSLDVTPDEQMTVTAAKTMHITELQDLDKQGPIDIAFLA